MDVHNISSTDLRTLLDTQEKVIWMLGCIFRDELDGLVTPLDLLTIMVEDPFSMVPLPDCIATRVSDIDVGYFGASSSLGRGRWMWKQVADSANHLLWLACARNRPIRAHGPPPRRQAVGIWRAGRAGPELLNFGGSAVAVRNGPRIRKTCPRPIHTPRVPISAPRHASQVTDRPGGAMLPGLPHSDDY